MISNNVKEVCYEYMCTGYENDLINEFYASLNFKIKRKILLDNFYIDAWSFCNKGYFNFKKNMPVILEKHVIKK